MRFNNNTNIPNKIVQGAVNSLNNIDEFGAKVHKPSFSFQDAYGNLTTTYRVTIEGIPTMIIKDVNNKYYDVTTVGNDKFYNIDKDGKKLELGNKKDE